MISELDVLCTVSTHQHLRSKLQQESDLIPVLCSKCTLQESDLIPVLCSKCTLQESDLILVLCSKCTPTGIRSYTSLM